MILRAVLSGGVALALSAAPLTAAAAAPLSPAESPSLALSLASTPSGEPVSLVVGLRSGADGVTELRSDADGVAGRRSDAADGVDGLRSDADVVAGLAKSVDVVAAEPLTGAVAVDVPAAEAAEAADVLRADPAVAYVEQDHIATAATTTPNEAAYGMQWGITRTRVNQAWDTTRGRGGVVVAVVDTGVKALPDFAGRILPGHDFVNDDSNATDDDGHGTSTAGIIAASGNNTVGIAGICWFCKILPVKVLDDEGAGSYSDIAEGIRWSADKGADIINLSLGGSWDSQLLRDAVAYATGKGVLVLAAAGNDGKSAQHFPAAIPSVIAVGGSTAGDARYKWSNYGSSWVDIAAPGCNPAQSMNGIVNQFCGTSSATPFASGVAALLASTTPTPTAATIRTALTSSADPISGGWVASSSGRINAAAALASLPVAEDTVAPATSFVSPSASALVRSPVQVAARATDDMGIAKVELLVDGKVVNVDRVAPYTLSWRPSNRGGTVTLGLRAYDRGGNVASATRKVLVDNWGPAVRITAGPASGTRHVRKTRYVTAEATDRNGIRSMELLVNGKIIQRYAGSAHSFAVQTWKFGSKLRVQIRAYDRAGNVSYAPARTWYR